jgi:dolichol-phosphate mannosyltransferase
MKLSVISPTYNESANVLPLIEALEKSLHGWDYEIIIADDDSPDLTWQIAEQAARHNPRIHVIRRTSNRGLGAAVIDGFLSASGDVVACIDADLQHDPSILPLMIREIAGGADLVVGSRYVPGGGTANWNWLRRFESWFATKLAQWLLRVKLNDPMSGYFMLRRKDFLRVRRELDGSGFKILLEIAARLKPNSIREVPYTFVPRVAGESKLSRKVVFCYLRQLCRLSRLGRVLSGEFLRFVVVGASGVAVNLSAMAILMQATRLRDWRASALATLIATVNNYVWNNLWTFRDRAHSGLAFVRKYVWYLAACLAGIGATTATFAGLSALVNNLPGKAGEMNLLLQLVAIMVGTLFNYILNRNLTWPSQSQATASVQPPIKPDHLQAQLDSELAN